MSMRSFGVRLPCISGYNKIVQTYRFLLSLALDSPTAGSSRYPRMFPESLD
ncbi:hypothetical protein PV05_03201 [Exophiala xenobiotica]|uniref:Uncharacterized protein n=1 Tax=Exophiala xenobiotica TaxID=348802 RepID=A0A0D2D8P3_9EURO|nr:uncharacterized protein PV05_03201 [Exophiala xenobiotica]KIW58702.1 hypothetical protein PV05_03201 [Exophiala xenobiotica]